MLLTIVVPCFNEESVLDETSRRLLVLLDNMETRAKVSAPSAIYFVDDGSWDNTWSKVKMLAANHPRVHGLKLSRNRGHQNALLAGLMNVSGDVVVSVDADLQDDIRVIEEMVDAHIQGSDIVYGVRGARVTDTKFKRATAEVYYLILKAMGVDIVFNHADFRLMSRRVLEALREYREVNIFLRGIVRDIGFPSSVVTYDRTNRFAGKSKYSLSKMLSLAIDGVTSFSPYPLRLIALLGLLTFFGTFALSLWVFWIKFFTGTAVPGWASSVLPMYLLGGIQLFSIGVLGEYVSKTYMETKLRPRYFIEEKV